MSQSTGVTRVSGTAVPYRSETWSSTDFDVTIEQRDAPQVMGSFHQVDLHFVVQVENRSWRNAVIKRLSLESAGDQRGLSPATRPFDITIEPQATATLEMWTTAYDADPDIGTRVPMMLRASLQSTHEGGRCRSIYVRSLNGRGAITGARATVF